jgi:hypothetical protein
VQPRSRKITKYNAVNALRGYGSVAIHSAQQVVEESKMKPKVFDTVEMKREGSARLSATLKDMTAPEELEFWRQQTEELIKRQRLIREQHIAS